MKTLHLIASVILVITFSAHARNLDSPPTAKMLREWRDGECVTAGKRVGIDYAVALENAINERSEGLLILCRFTDSDGFVGAAAENHCSILLGLLQRWNDEAFARVLRSQIPRIRKAVIDAIDYAYPNPGWKSSEFPKTYLLALHENPKKT